MSTEELHQLQDKEMTDLEDTGSPVSSPTEIEPDSPLSPSQDTKGEYTGAERVFAANSPESGVSVGLQSRKLWKQFDNIGTEMIVTRRGRRMFPPIKVDVFDLKPDSYYVLLMDMSPADKYRYKYTNSRWVRCFEEECSTTRLYIHPDSPALGSHWMNCVISFYKLKLTNNQLDRQGHIIVNSMHRYQPRLHIVESNDISNLNWDKFSTFIFPGTQFTTVTAYQNDKITQLKISHNPFAKGFRSPFSRCRTRPRSSLPSGSDSGQEDLKTTQLLPTHLVMPGQERLRAPKRPYDSSDQDEDVCSVYKQIRLAPTSETPLIRVHSIPSTTQSGTLSPHSPSPTTPQVFIMYSPGSQPTMVQPSAAALIPSSNGIIPTPAIVSSGALNQPHTTLMTSSGVSPAGGTIVQPQTMIPVTSHVGASLLNAQKLNGAKVVSRTNGVGLNGTIVHNSQAGAPFLNGTTFVQGTQGPLQLVQSRSGHSVVSSASNGITTVQSNGMPSQLLKTMVTFPENGKTPKLQGLPLPLPVSIPSGLKSLIKEGQKSPPPLVPVSCVSPKSVVSPNFMRVNSGEEEPQAHKIDVKSVISLAPASKPPTSNPVVFIPTQNGATANANSVGQTLIPVAYDQVMASMPIYRLGGATNGLSSCIQILTPVALTQNSITTA